MRGVKGRAGGRGALVSALALVLAACGSGGGDADDAVVTTGSPTTSTTAATTAASAASVATTGASTTATTASVAGSQVGSPALFEAEVDAIYDFFGSFLPPRDEVPLPDVTNPDPVAALESMLMFDDWQLRTAPTPDWVDLYAIGDDGFARDARILADQMMSVGAVLAGEEPYQFHGGEVVEPADARVPAGLAAGLPDGTVFVSYESSAGPTRMEVVATGEIFNEYDGWERTERLAGLAPTESGWRMVYVGSLG